MHKILTVNWLKNQMMSNWRAWIPLWSHKTQSIECDLMITPVIQLFRSSYSSKFIVYPYILLNPFQIIQSKKKIVCRQFCFWCGWLTSNCTNQKCNQWCILMSSISERHEPQCGDHQQNQHADRPLMGTGPLLSSYGHTRGINTLYML
jgi:hypothetical protein